MVPSNERRGLLISDLDNPVDPDTQLELNHGNHLEAVPGAVNTGNPANVSRHPAVTNPAGVGVRLGTYEEDNGGKFILVKPSEGHTDVAGGAELNHGKLWDEEEDWLLRWLWDQNLNFRVIGKV